ncbi:MAG: sugar phosphate isomerase/epimerase [Planctomycetaceae bacterium]|jgi:inosose dehydratase|nr:sugar phosphate isomerase/epimerase [Planctomycetaceae bacterium]
MTNTNTITHRRSFLKAATFTAAGILAAQNGLKAEDKADSNRLHIAVNQYTANNIYRRDNQNFLDRLDELKSAGADGLEPTVGTAAELENIGKKLKDHGLAVRSVYVGGNLHDANAAEKEIARLQAVGEKAKELGSRIIVYNAAPKHGKTDAELTFQSQNADKLGAALAQIGITLALHYHTTELEFGGREFHHLLCGTAPKYFSLCLEQHWSYRACGNSQLALFDHLALYADRVSMVHLRQSVKNVWSETFGDGDIDNEKLAAGLKKLKTPPHFVLEQAAEKGTPKTLPAKEVFRSSLEYIRRVFTV